MSDMTDARDAFLSLCGYDGTGVATPLQRYGVAAPRPDLAWVESALLKVTKEEDEDAYEWTFITERGKMLALVILVGHFVRWQSIRTSDGKWDGRYLRNVTVACGLAPKVGTITPGRAWTELSPWREGAGYRARRNLKNKVETWAEWKRDDRVTFEFKFLPTMLSALRERREGESP